MGPQTLRYGDAAIPYTVLRRPNVAGKIAIHVHHDGRVEVDAPDCASLEQIRAAVRKRARWVSGHIEKVRDRQRDLLPRQYISGESHFYLGRRYVLKVLLMTATERKAGHKPCVKLIGGQLRVLSPERDAKVVMKLLREWYREKAHLRFETRLAVLAERMSWVKKNDLPRVKLLDMKKHWGSCSPSGSIVLNPHLVKAPRDCIDYVICHELCHLKEHNHSKKYWGLMDRVCPEWPVAKDRLDEMAEVLLNQ